MSLEQKRYWQSGVNFERKRIIKLLKPFAKHDESCSRFGCYPDDCSAPNYEHAIELIKGERDNGEIIGRTQDYFNGMTQGRIEERERIIKIIEKRRDYDCRCKCKCHAVPAPCIACQADNGLIEIIRGEN